MDRNDKPPEASDEMCKWAELMDDEAWDQPSTTEEQLDLFDH